ncbi:hypothetical protein [Niabella drilacis]|uniref:Right handed beta helix region n=1 Tax=Niabella drilacis (strain DSM 25811 / CCM 8410 / CCUG 62505 / LMG 26954 / E90) TaxID=1285928 RepID=A0A1G6IA56_NIADE|nr:hypothetical protein [Niabella drilacis]SDC03351.1 hypothetical protein SAMN04487894_101150 [Niabella drilacis]
MQVRVASFCLLVLCISAFSFKTVQNWPSSLAVLNSNGTLTYKADEKGNTLPDFSKVGYRTGNVPIPDVPVAAIVGPGSGAESAIQQAIDALSKKAMDKNGFRGAILLRKGTYSIANSIRINASGIVLRGEGNQTLLVAEGSGKRALINVSGTGDPKEVKGTRTSVAADYVPTGSMAIPVKSARAFKPGDPVIIHWTAKDQWIEDLKMNQIEERPGTKQWQAKEYDFKFQRTVTRIEGNTLFIDNPVVMAIEGRYNTAEVYTYEFPGRIANVGIENLACASAYTSDTAENHSWDAVALNRIENGWVSNVSARYFAYSCVNLGALSRNISVLNCVCSDHKSIITGGRRYSFNNNGQMNLFMNCTARDGRHDYVTGARVCGPNVFYNCTASRTHADIGPHHRWAMGTLYDNIITDGEINIQDRGNWGSGHGWAGVNQVLWNCTAQKATVQSPWVSGKNYCIGLRGQKAKGRLAARPDGEWEGQNKPGLEPASLYLAQLKARGQ